MPNEITITINIPGLDRLISAVENLTTGKNTESLPLTCAQPANPYAPQQPILQQTPYTMPQQIPAPIAPAPIAPAPAAPIPVAPTVAPPAYTIDILSAAAAPLMAQGKQAELTGLLQSFGVQALTLLPQERYGEFATALRGLGAKL